MFCKDSFKEEDKSEVSSVYRGVCGWYEIERFCLVEWFYLEQSVLRRELPLFKCRLGIEGPLLLPEIDLCFY